MSGLFADQAKPTRFLVHPYISSGNPATTEDFLFTNAPRTASDYNFSFTYHSNQGSPGQGNIKVNGGARQITFNTEVADGGTRTVTGRIYFFNSRRINCE
ncbi:hypothetical protein [Spirosoma panaciterrae]|uniref:hypothetical protein n=1 Tax=Spirosoma panaciterrae TaxID=496058 RepID=UPI0003747B36|nr:hypothetical protein [Spirosoma panaciterrae]